MLFSAVNEHADANAIYLKQHSVTLHAIAPAISDYFHFLNQHRSQTICKAKSLLPLLPLLPALRHRHHALILSVQEESRTCPVRSTIMLYCLIKLCTLYSVCLSLWHLLFCLNLVPSILPSLIASRHCWTLYTSAHRWCQHNSCVYCTNRLDAVCFSCCCECEFLHVHFCMSRL